MTAPSVQRSTLVRPGALTELLKEIAAPTFTGGPDGAGEPTGLAPGDRVGRFEVVRQIGRGGFGTVYEANDLELGRAVALKLVRPGRMPERRAELLRAEAEAAARLAHPNIVQLYDLGASERGPYLVMELLRGEALDERLEGGPLEPREALRISVEVARGLAHAHAQGVVHRDLKPGNVFLCEDRQVKVLDFGLAAVFGRSGPAGGTPAYMAPEQARGEVGDERSDVYALGAMLFELLTGKPPYDPKGERGVPAGGEAPEVAGAPAALKKLLARMLAQEPKDRHRNGEEAHAELAAFQRTIERKRPWVAWSIAACGLLAVGAMFYQALQPHLPPGRLLTAMADVANDTGDPDLDGVGTFLRTALEPSRRLSLVNRARLVKSAFSNGSVDEAVARRAAVETGATLVLVPAVHRAPTGYEVELRVLETRRSEPLFTVREHAGAKSGTLAALDALADSARRALDESARGLAADRVTLAQAIPDNPELWRRWAEAKQLETSAEPVSPARLRAAYQRCLDLDPEFPLAHAALAAWPTGLDDLARHLDAALAGKHRVPLRERLMVEGRVAELRFRTEDAFSAYDRAIAGWPQDPEAYVRAGTAAMLNAQAARARPYFEKAVEVGALREASIIEALVILGRLDEALSRAERWVERSPGRRSYLLLAAARRARGEPEAARAVLARAAAVGATVPPALSTEWDEMTGLWVHVDADAWAELDGMLPADRLWAVRWLHLRGRRREALELLDRLAPAASAPAVSRALHHLERSYQLAGEFDGDPAAVWAEMSQATLLGAINTVCYAGRLALVGDIEHAAMVDAPWAMLNPEAPCRALYLAAVAWRRGDLEAAAREYAALSWPEAIHLLGEVRLQQGRDREAVEAFRRFRRWPEFNLEGYIEYPRSLYLEAVALERLGERDEALKAVTRLLRLWERADPEIPTFQKAKALRKRLTGGD